MTIRSFSSVAAVLTAFDIRPAIVPSRTIVVHDPLKDLDDTVAGVAEAGLHHEGMVEIVGALGVLNPARERARAIKGGFIELGLPEIRVSSGSDITLKEYAFGYETCSYLAPEDTLVRGTSLLDETFSSALSDLNLVIAAGMTDIAEAIRSDPDGVAQALASVTIMGGVKIEQAWNGYKVVLNKDGFMEPDEGETAAANNNFDHKAAAAVYRFCQEYNVPLTVLTREAAYACQINLGKFYGRMAATGSPIGSHLVETQAPSLRLLWARTNAPQDSELRGKLPMRCDRRWFVDTFCLGNDPGKVDDIWPHIRAGQAYDLMAFLASIPEIRDRFFAPVEVDVNGVVHRVIGLNQKWHNGEVADVEGLREFMHELCIATLIQYQRKT